MSKLLLGLGLAASIVTAMPAQAATLVPMSVSPTEASIILVSGGCGPYAHRGPYGGCQPGGQAGVEHCPYGYHLGPHGRACFPNRF